MRNSTPFVVVALVVALTACSAPTPPVASPAPTASLDADAALLKEAEDVYRKLSAEETRILQEGISIPTKTITDNAAESYLKQLKSVFSYAHDNGIKTESHNETTIFNTPATKKDDSLVALAFCEDARRSKIFKNGKEDGYGILVEGIAQFKKFDGKLKLYSMSSKEVSKCESH
ncbi:MAG: hypothetical protein ACRDAX_00735 [Propionibacteriaceae bacterium]